MLIGIITLISALLLAAGAAYYSIVGLMAIFSGAAIAVAVCAGFIELGKIVSVIWLHKYWDAGYTRLKYVLTIQVLVAMLITSMGIFGFLSKAHLEQNADTKNVTIQIERLEERKETLVRRREKATALSAQLDNAIDKYIELGYVTRGLDRMNEQKESRDQLRKEIDDIDIQEATVDNSIQELRKEITALELEVGPAKYIAELIYGDEAEQHFDKAVRYIILMLIFIFDPLAVTMLIAAQVSFGARKPKATTIKDHIHTGKKDSALSSMKEMIERKKTRMRERGK